MAEFILGAAIALVVGVRLVRHIDGSRGARSDYRKASTELPGARKKAYNSTLALVRFIVIVGLIVIAAAYGWITQNG